MLAYKRVVTVKEAGSIVLKDLPLQQGQRVEVVVFADEEGQKERLKNLRALLKETQGLPQAKAISDDEIAEEVAAYRAVISAMPRN
ncbi:MAG: hypothetical protein HZA15_14935 [Nitrospirae bacterium]|nr:hypothetical protein [Nitrospirota bacterium]